MRVSFIIATYNRDPYIKKCVESLFNQTAPKDSYEILVIDNNSTDQTSKICEALQINNDGSDFSYYLEKNQGLSHARNRGIREAQYEILVFLDDDAFAEQHYVENLIEFYIRHPDVYATGGRTYPLYESQKPAWMSYFLNPLVAAVDKGDQALPFKNKEYPIGANMSFKIQVFQKIGGFNINLGRTGKNMMAGEEKDLFMRMRAYNYYPWYVPSTIVQHIIPDSRMKVDYIKKQAIGIGYSEKIRVKSLGLNAVIKKYISEILKWGVSIVLFVIYFITFQIKKALMIIRFRYWVSKGLFISNAIL